MPRPIRLDVETKSDTRGIDRTAKATDRLGDEFSELSRDAAQLDRRMSAVRKEMARLAGELSRTVDQVERTRLDKAFSGEAQALSKLRRYRSALDEVADQADETARRIARMGAVAAVTPKGGGLFSMPLGSPVMLGGIGAGVAGSPLIAGALSGAVVGALGLGGVAAGLAAAFQDGTVKASAASLGHEIRDDFFAAGQGFADSALVSLEKVRRAWRSELNPEFRAITAASERLLAPLTDAALDFASTILPGIRYAIERAGPVVDALGAGVERFGEAFAFAFEKFGDNAETSGDALEDVAVSAANVTAGLAAGADQLTKVYGGFVAVREAAKEVATEVGSWVGIGGPTKSMLREIGEVGSDSIGGVSKAVIDARRELADMFDAIEDGVHRFFGLEEAEDGVANAAQRLRDQLKEQREEHEKGAGALTGSTLAALANREAVRNLVDKYVALAEQNTAAGRSNAGLRGELVKTLVQLGFNRAEAEKYAAALGSIPTSKTTTVRVKFLSDTSNYHPPTLAPGQYAAMAAGGITRAARGLTSGGWTDKPMILFGERQTGRELFLPERGISKSRAASLLAAGAQMHGLTTSSGYNSMPPARTAGGGRLSGTLTVDPGMTSGLAREIVKMLRIEIINDGGGNVQLALGN